MADLLPGYTYDRQSARYRDATTGRFVARERITELLDQQVAGAEKRLAALSEAHQAGRIEPGLWADQMRQEVKRQHLQEAALAKGGWDKLDQSDYGRVGQALRQLYPKIEGTARDIQDGKVSPAQLQNRIDAYAGSARTLYHDMERRQAAPDEGMVLIELRRLDPNAQHCKQCPEYAAQGWQVAGILPVPGDECDCGHHCRCSLARREIPVDEVDRWIGTRH